VARSKPVVAPSPRRWRKGSRGAPPSPARRIPSPNTAIRKNTTKNTIRSITKSTRAPSPQSTERVPTGGRAD